MIVIGFILVAAVGTMARVAVGSGLNHHDFHFGTLAVNVIGSFLLGWLAGSGVSTDTLTVFGTGALGSFTTFSTLSHETAALCRRHRVLRGATYVGITAALGIGAAWVGLSI